MAGTSTKSHPVAVRVPNELHKRLARVTRNTNLSMSALIVLTLMEAYPGPKVG